MHATFNMTTLPKSAQVVEPKIRAIIYGHGRAWVFTPRDLAKLGAPRSVGMALTRLYRKGIIRQLARALYDYPIDHPSLGRIAASADAVAKALASRDAVRLQPAGAYAVNFSNGPLRNGGLHAFKPRRDYDCPQQVWRKTFGCVGP